MCIYTYIYTYAHAWKHCLYINICWQLSICIFSFFIEYIQEAKDIQTLETAMKIFFFRILIAFIILYKWLNLYEVIIVLEYLCHKEVITLLKDLKHMQSSGISLHEQNSGINNARGETWWIICFSVA